MSLKEIYRFLSPKWQNAFLDYKVEPKPRFGRNQKHNSNPFLHEIFSIDHEKYKTQLAHFLKYQNEIQTITTERKGNVSPYWNNGFLPGLDIISLYGIIREQQPKRYVEIGSGHSTKVVYKAIQEGNLNTEIISIDPYPRSEIDHLSDHIIRKPVETIDYDDPIFTALTDGDVLFIDSSHRLLPNSDCAFIYNELLPSLPSGVIIHIHDIYLPYDYPQFMCDRWYNENQVLATFFLSNPEYFEVLLPCFYVYKNQEIWEVVEPLFEGNNMQNVERHGGSIWMRKR